MVTMHPGTSELPVDNWSEVSVDEVANMITKIASARRGATKRPIIVGLDGRSGAGKSTLARVLAKKVDATIVETDDLAWWEPMFSWADMAIEHVLRPVCQGEPIAFRPPEWKFRGRPGAITIPKGVPAVILEGVAASQSKLTPFIDVSIWVQSDCVAARNLGLLRDAVRDPENDTQKVSDFWEEWQSEEVPFFEKDRPWDRADFVLGGAGIAAEPGFDTKLWSHLSDSNR